MSNNHESLNIDFDKVLREIQEESVRRLGEILEGSASSEISVEPSVREFRVPRIIDIFIPPGAR